ncbi:MAG: hypothetical protein HY900_27725 [Deltaproteobacteria bacterium]|nr:hypothetical protein [Deltaproteobacteria bacterium]
MRKGSGRLLAASATAAVFFAGSASAVWEIGAKGAASSNVLRALGGDQADQYLYGYVSYSRAPEGERKLDWDLGISVEGALYREVTGFSYGGAVVSPGLRYSISPGWTLSVAPFVQVKAANDSDLSALAFGARLALQQHFGSGVYAGEYYRYTDSDARESVFSYTENAFGAFVGYNWTPSLWTELGYEFARGESFQTVGATFAAPLGHGVMRAAAPLQPGGGGMHGGGAPGGRFDDFAAGNFVRDTVDSHDVTVTAGYAWSSTFSTYVGYTFGRSSGDFGSETSHTGFLGSAYRF